jgi:RimJ/RimL family protein N-acetyltransferase
MDNQFVLRRADVSDIDALSQLSQKTFRETFVEDFSIPYPEKDLQSFFHSSASPEFFANRIIDPKRAAWVIEDKMNDDLIGYALVGPCNNIPHPDVCSNKDGLLNRFFIRRDQRNHGFGQQLMNEVLLWLEEHYPARPVWLSVFSENFKAQNFYAHYGFKKVGEYDYCIGEWKDHGFIMKCQHFSIKEKNS